MKLSHISKSATVVALAFMASACDEGLTEVNENPNAPAEVSADLLFPQALQSSVSRTLGSSIHLDQASLWVQHFAKIQYITEDRYYLRPARNDIHWQGYYAGPLQDLHQVIQKSQGEPSEMGAAKVMQQWTFASVTDIWGDVPYSQALQGMEALAGKEGVTAPKYDPQSEIYAGILKELTAASAMIQPGSQVFGAPDLIYRGNAEKWRKFANSLRLRYAMRMSEVAPATARAEFQKAMAAPGGVFTSNADIAQLAWTSSKPTNAPLNSYFFDSGRYDHVISATIVDTLKRLDDPRLAVYADKNEKGGYQGQPNAASKLSFNELSSIGAYFLKPDAPSVIMSYAEVLFLQAEAAARGWIAGDPAALYRQGIEASMRQYGIPQAEITTYLAQPQVKYDGLKSIYLQKWIAFYGNGVEAWSDYRRNGMLETLKPGPLAYVKKVPVRFPYPPIEQSVNSANLTSANLRQGGGATGTFGFFTPVWWDGGK